MSQMDSDERLMKVLHEQVEDLKFELTMLKDAYLELEHSQKTLLENLDSVLIKWGRGKVE